MLVRSFNNTSSNSDKRVSSGSYHFDTHALDNVTAMEPVMFLDQHRTSISNPYLYNIGSGEHRGISILIDDPLPMNTPLHEKAMESSSSILASDSMKEK
jgi:hypothetical protein